MNFSSFLASHFKKGSNHIKISYQLVRGNHDFPTNLSSKASWVNWCNKNNVGASAIESLNIAWGEFESKPYATLHGKNTRKKLRKYID